MEKFGEVNKGTYVSAKFSESTLNAVKKFQEDFKIPNPIPLEKVHCTIVFSRKYINYIPDNSTYMAAESAKSKVFLTQSGKRALVLALCDADALKFRHNYANAIGATYDFPDYIPHITVSYDIGVLDFPEGVEFVLPFEVVGEEVEDLDLEWKA